MAFIETTDVLVIGTGFGGAIPAFRLAAGGAKVVMLERGPWRKTSDIKQDLQLGTYTQILDLVMGDGVEVIAGNVVGGSSVVYLAASMRAPSFVFERRGGGQTRLWPGAIDRGRMDKYYDLVERALPVSPQDWDDVSYGGGVFAAACKRAGWTCNPVPVAVNVDQCARCGWMATGCRFGAKRSMILNYLPAAVANGAQIRELHEVQQIRPATTSGYRYAVDYMTLNRDDYRRPTGGNTIEAKFVIMAAGAMGTPVILKRSANALGGMPDAVGRYFSPNGDHVSLAVFDDEMVQSLLGLNHDGVGYKAHALGRSIGTTTFDKLDADLPEGMRYALQQIYYPPIVNLMPEDGVDGDPVWFGTDKKALSKQWPSWMAVLAMIEDGNEGEFGTPPPWGNFTRLASAASLAQLTYRASEQTIAARAAAERDISDIVTKDGLAQFLRWKQTEATLTAHPLASCRMGDDPATSALDDRNQLRGHDGIFVTDASAVPTSLCVNPSLTVAALAERSVPFIVDSARAAGIDVDYDDALPGDGELTTLG